MDGRHSALCRWDRLVKHREEYSGKEEGRSRCGASLDISIYFPFSIASDGLTHVCATS